MVGAHYIDSRKAITESINGMLLKRNIFPHPSIHSRFPGRYGKLEPYTQSAACDKNRKTGKKQLPETNRKPLSLWESYILPIENPMHQALFTVLALFGCRISEALDLRKRDFWVEYSKKSNEPQLFKIEFPTKKNPDQKQRIVPINYQKNKAAIEVMINYKETLPAADSLLFPISRVYVWKLAKVYFGKNYFLHWFRHFSATAASRSGNSTSLMMLKYGWKSRYSCDPYIHLNSKDLDDFELRPDSDLTDVRPDLPEIQPINKKKPEGEDDWW